MLLVLLHRVVLPVHGGVRVRPVGHGHRRPVLLRRGLVVDGQELHGLRLLGLEVDDGVGAVPLARVEDEVAVKVPGGVRVDQGSCYAVPQKVADFEFEVVLLPFQYLHLTGSKKSNQDC